MGNARSASYSYHHPLEQQEERHRSLPSPLQYPSRNSAQGSSHPPNGYWDDNNSALANADGSDDADEGKKMTANDEIISCVFAPSGGGGGDEPPPLPFVRHRNAPIRLPRININKESWPQQQQQPFGYSLNRRGRHKSLSCSMMHGRMDANGDGSAAFAAAARLHVNLSAKLNGDLMRNEAPPPPPASVLSLGDEDDDDVEDASSDQDGTRLRGAVSCAALLLQCDPLGDRSIMTARRHYQLESTNRDRMQVSVNNNKQQQQSDAWKTGQPVSNPFKRQFLSMRAYGPEGSRHHQRRPLLLPRSCSVRPSPSLSVPILTELDGGQFQNVKVKNYLEMARQKKQSVEQSLSQTRHPAASDDYYPLNLLATGPGSSTETDDPARHLEQQQQAGKSGLHKSWTSISQESLGDGEEGEEDEDGGYTTTLTVGDNGSLRSRYSDSSYLTLLTANTSLSSGYHGPASLGDPHPSSSSCSEASDEENQRQQMMAAHCDGTTSGLFYLEWLRQVTGTIPSYVELRQGRLHLKLIQGQCISLSRKLANNGHSDIVPPPVRPSSPIH